jgi:hypothetical protein
MLLPVHMTSGRLAIVLGTGAVRDIGDARACRWGFAAKLAGMARQERTSTSNTAVLTVSSRSSDDLARGTVIRGSSADRRGKGLPSSRVSLERGWTEEQRAVETTPICGARFEEQ